MNKNLVIAAVVIIVLLLLGAGGFFLMSKNSLPAVQQENNSQTTPTTQNTPTMKSLRDLMMGGTAQKCTFADTTTAANVSGTTYISSGKVRTDFSTKSEETAVMGHMIVDGNVSYLWMDGQPTGFKMAFDPNETTSTTNAESNSQQGVDANKAMNFQCSGWSADSSLFVPPSSVKFTDTSAVTAPSGSGTTAPSTGSQCSACNSLAGDAKTQCLTALKCN